MEGFVYFQSSHVEFCTEKRIVHKEILVPEDEDSFRQRRLGLQ